MISICKAATVLILFGVSSPSWAMSWSVCREALDGAQQVSLRSRLRGNHEFLGLSEEAREKVLILLVATNFEGLVQSDYRNLMDYLFELDRSHPSFSIEAMEQAIETIVTHLNQRYLREGWVPPLDHFGEVKGDFQKATEVRNFTYSEMIYPLRKIVELNLGKDETDSSRKSTLDRLVRILAALDEKVMKQHSNSILAEIIQPIFERREPLLPISRWHSDLHPYFLNQLQALMPKLYRVLKYDAGVWKRFLSLFSRQSLTFATTPERLAIDDILSKIKTLDEEQAPRPSWTYKAAPSDRTNQPHPPDWAYTARPPHANYAVPPPPVATPEFYNILGVPKDASQDLIKKSFRALAIKYHPDHNPGNKEAEARFKEIGAAYEVLGDADRRAAYDRENR